MKRRTRRQWKPTRQGLITALGLINAAFVFLSTSAPELEMPSLVIKWLGAIAVVALIWRGMLEQEARDEARRLPPPKEPPDAP